LARIPTDTHAHSANQLQLKSEKNPHAGSASCEAGLFHQKHLAGSLDRSIQAPLIMRRQPGVLSWQDATLIRHKLLQQIDVFEIESIDGKVNLRLRPWRATFHPG
jgi:hypothetical protein